MDFLQPFPNIEVDHCTFLAKNGVSGAAHQRRWQCSACITCFVLVVVFVKTYCWITTYSRFLYLILDGHLIHLYTAMIWVVKVFLAPIKVHWRCHFTTLLTWRMLSFDLPLNDVQITILSQQDIYVKIKGVYRTGFFSSVKYLVCAKIAIYLFFSRELVLDMESSS